MVCLRAVDVADVFGRAQYRFLDAQPLGIRLWQHRHSSQHSDHDLMYALPRDESRENALAGVAQPRHVRYGRPCHQPANGSTADVAGRSLPRGTLLRHPSWRLSGNLDALLLGLRPSRSLRPRYPGMRLRIRDHPSLLTQGYLRLSGHGGCDNLHWVHWHERLGASHVHGRYELKRQYVLRAVN